MNLAPLRSYLSRMEREFDNIYDETVHACADLLPSTAGELRNSCYKHVTHQAEDSCHLAEWGTITGYIETSQLIARVLNRIIVGVPICPSPTCLDYRALLTALTVGRNPRYISSVIQFAASTIKASIVLKFVPSRLRPSVLCVIRQLHQLISIIAVCSSRSLGRPAISTASCSASREA